MVDVLFDDRFPFYLQVRKLIVDGIANEDYVEGGKIPSSAMLAAEYEVNHLTTRRAVTDLVAGGYLKIIRGKGTYVVDGARDRLRSDEGKLITGYDIPKMVRTARMIRMKQGVLVDALKAELKKQLSEED